jgi:hypothetical protein
MPSRLPSVTRTSRPEPRWPWQAPTCSANVGEFTLRWRKPEQGSLCTNRGIISIDGVHFCERHAGRFLLTWHLKNGV